MKHSDLLKLHLPASYDANGENIGAELVAEGAALDQAQWSADQLLLEMDPRTTTVMLPDWERVYGLPDACIVAYGIQQSISERRAALVSLESMQGGQDKPFFVALAAAMGYAITIDEGAPHVTEHNTEHPVYDEKYRYIWIVNAPLYNIRELTSEDDTEMATAVWGNKLLECRINRFKPAHTHVIFAYS